jgi:ABC-type transport system involved in multi-copper enzyme maturation permease subunit
VIAQLRSELLKIRSTRSTIGLVLGLVALVLLFVLLSGLLQHESALTSADDQRNYLGIGSLASLFAALAGLLVVTGEYRFGTIRPTFLVTPRRWVVVGAKYLAGLAAGIAFAVVGQGLALAIGLGILSARGIPRSLSGGSLTQLALGCVAAAALWGGIGAGLGAVVRNQVAGVIGVLAWVLLVENLLFGLVPSVGRLTPGRAQDALTGMTAEHLLSAAAGAAVLIAWSVALLAAGLAAVQARDVT